MDKIFENPTKIFALTKERTREFYDNLYDKMIEEGKDVVDYQEIKAMSTGVLCPDCNSSHVIKNGLQSGVQLPMQKLWKTIQSYHWHIYVWGS